MESKPAGFGACALAADSAKIVKDDYGIAAAVILFSACSMGQALSVVSIFVR